MPDAPAPSLRRDLISAYVASEARIGSWAVVSAVVYRTQGAEPFAILALIRSTLSFLNFSTLGLAPALVRMLATARQRRHVEPIVEGELEPTTGQPVLAYASRTPRHAPDPETMRVYASAQVLALLLALAAFVAVGLYANTVGSLHQLPPRLVDSAAMLVVTLGVGIVLRLVSEPAAGLLQVEGRIALDNWLQVGADVVWCLAVLVLRPPTEVVGLLFLIASGGLLVARSLCTSLVAVMPRMAFLRPTLRLAMSLLAAGLLITFSQLADFLYAPVDFILISRLLDPVDVATYAPAVQVDAALLVLVTGLAATLLPRAAVAHAGGDVAAVRRYYVRGTLASLLMLLVAAVVVWAVSPWLFTLWLGDSLPATRAILPLMLAHTVVGGSGAVGRSILLGMGKVKPYAVAALVAGVANVVLSYCFVKYLGLGLNGIVLGTIVAVVGRCVVWQPWYVLRCLRAGRGNARRAPYEPWV